MIIDGNAKVGTNKSPKVYNTNLEMYQAGHIEILEDELLSAYEIIDWKFNKETNDTCGAFDLAAEQWLERRDNDK